MKAYGYSRKDKQTCKYGCCTMRCGGKHSDFRPLVDKSRRKTARQQ